MRKTNPLTATTFKIGLMAALMQDNSADFLLYCSIAEITEIIRQDLFRLLNTRRQPVTIANGLTAVNNSLYNYGMLDLSLYDPSSASDRERARQLLQDAIECFEPRLKNIRVSNLLNQTTAFNTQLRFRIEAELAWQKLTETIVFDSHFEPNKEKIYLYHRQE